MTTAAKIQTGWAEELARRAMWGEVKRKYPNWKGESVYAFRQSACWPPRTRLTNKAPMARKWPVNEHPPPNDIFLGDRAPVAAIGAVITVVAQRKVFFRAE